MPEQLRMVPGGLEEKVFSTLEGRVAKLPGMQNPVQYLWLMFLLAGILLPVIVTFNLAIWTGLTHMLSTINSSQVPSAMPELFRYNTAHAWFLITAMLLNSFNLWIVHRRVLASRARLAESDLVLRILDGWEPDLQDNSFQTVLRNFEIWRKRKGLLVRFYLSFTQLSYVLGLRQKASPPRLQTVLILFAVIIATTSLGFGFIVLPSRLLTQGLPTDAVHFVMAYVCLVLVNLIGHPPLVENGEAVLLIEHLREIDNGVLGIELPEQAEDGDA